MKQGENGNLGNIVTVSGKGIATYSAQVFMFHGMDSLGAQPVWAVSDQGWG